MAVFYPYNCQRQEIILYFLFLSSQETYTGFLQPFCPAIFSASLNTSVLNGQFFLSQMGRSPFRNRMQSFFGIRLICPGVINFIPALLICRLPFSNYLPYINFIYKYKKQRKYIFISSISQVLSRMAKSYYLDYFNFLRFSTAINLINNFLFNSSIFRIPFYCKHRNNPFIFTVSTFHNLVPL